MAGHTATLSRRGRGNARDPEVIVSNPGDRFAYSDRVSDGTRTRDLQGHNLAL